MVFNAIICPKIYYLTTCPKNYVLSKPNDFHNYYEVISAYALLIGSISLF